MSGRVTAALIATCCVALLAACGDEDGVGDDAVVTAYVEAPLCAEAERELARAGAGDLKVRVSCLPKVHKDEKLNLSQIGADARQATEDSSSIAYIAVPDKRARSFSLPILEEADIPRLTSSSGAKAISQLLQAIEEADEATSLRQAVDEELQQR